MQALSANELLWAWEWGQGHYPVDWALTLLNLACPEKSREELARLSVGQRDGLLLTLREQTLGRRLDGLAECPGCGERLEFSLDIADLRPAEGAQSALPEYWLERDGVEVRFRLPNSLDLAAVTSPAPDRSWRVREQTRQAADEPSRRLFSRCLLSAERAGTPLTAGELPDGVVDAVEEAMAAADPGADIRLEITCPVCGAEWQPALDIVSFFYAEIDAWVDRTVREVHALASRYGWREADILAMSPRRRQLYLSL